MPNREEYRDREGRTFPEFVADQVMAEIIAKGKSVRGVARESGINHETLRGRIHNVRPFTIRELSLVAAALGVHPAEFVKATSFLIVGDVTITAGEDGIEVESS